MSYWERTLISRRRVLQGAAAAAGGTAAFGLVGCGDDDASGGAKQSGPAGEVVDWTAGKPGGTINVGTNNYPDSLEPTSAGGGRVFGFTHDGLLQFKAGKSGVDPNSLDVEPNIAQALPETPNELTYIFKL